MTNEEILSRVLNILGYDKLDISKFDERLKIQKIIYLLQYSGLSLGYGYNWYVRGPYSPGLTQTIYSISEDESIFEESKNLRFHDHDDIVSNLDDFKVKLGEKINDVNYLEVLASLHYINKVTFSGKGSEKNLKKKLREAKPSLYTLSNINQLVDDAYADLKKFN